MIKDLTIPLYKEALAKSGNLDAIQNKGEEVFKKEKNEIYKKYSDLKWKLEAKIRKLERVQDKKTDAVKKREERYQAKMSNKKQPSFDIISDTKKLFDLLDIIKREAKEPLDLQELPEEVIDTIADDQYKKIVVSIGENRKPKNKFSLIIRGLSIFQWGRIDRLEYSLKDLPTEKALLEWYNKNKNELKIPVYIERSRNDSPYWSTNKVSNYLAEHASLERDYERAKIFYGSKKWKLLHLNHIKETYSHSKDNESYIAAVEEIMILKTAKKKLPLLIGELKTDDGKFAFEQRLKGA